jgi:hypothetical protein
MAAKQKPRSVKRTRQDTGGDKIPLENTRCSALAAETADLVRDILAREADRKSESGLSREDIELLVDDFKSRMEQRQFQTFFKRSAQHCLQVAQRSGWAAQRERVLDRVLVKRFSHLFPDTDTQNKEVTTLPRSCLPGILQGIRLLVGSEYYDNCQRQARQRFQDLPAKSAEERWEVAYQDTNINGVVLDVIVHTAPGFQDLDYRFDWLTNLIERNLAAKEGGPPPFGRAQYFALLRALFAEPAALMAKGEGQTWLRERYGERLVGSLSALLTQIQG